MDDSNLKRGRFLYLNDILFVMKDIQAAIVNEGISTYFTMIIPQNECEITLDETPFHALSHDLIFAREDMQYQATEPLLVYDFKASFFDSP